MKGNIAYPMQPLTFIIQDLLICNLLDDVGNLDYTALNNQMIENKGTGKM
jgi:hypothetical protein